ncbi:hypothetical protein [Nocardia sp. NPDC058114]|uniref:hypothetical protein n=1 Tax=Nocardia sp. NPDC058114 TaxID=3346346 RepID=UPI0036DD9D65
MKFRRSQSEVADSGSATAGPGGHAVSGIHHDHRIYADHVTYAGPPPKRKAPTGVVAAGVAGVLVAGAAAVWFLFGWESRPDGSAFVVQSVTGPPGSPSGDRTFVLEDRRKLSSSELDAINSVSNAGGRQALVEVVPGGVPEDVATIVMTVSTERSEEVRITGIRALKECGTPFDGTYFDGYSQGNVDANVEIGMNLDSPEALAQPIIAKRPAGEPFFKKNSLPLTAGKSTTLTIGAFTSRHGCSFRLEVKVTASDGESTYVVDDHGQPFKVTSKVAVAGKFPLAGYQAAYMQDETYGWQSVDPSTFEGR